MPVPTPDLPIAAKIKGPGPAAYKLPSTLGRNSDVTLPYKPACGLGKRFKDDKNTNPGPKYIVNGRMTRKGETGQLTATLKGRFNETKNPQADFPAPGTYDPIIPLGRVSTTTCTIKGPYKSNARNRVPPPNAYTLPKSTGSYNPTKKNGSSYAIKGKLSAYGYDWDFAKTVGPASYKVTDANVYKHRNGQFTIKSRVAGPRDKSGDMPGPAAYNLNQVNYSMKKSAPKFSIGSKHSDFVMPVFTPVDII